MFRGQMTFEEHNQQTDVIICGCGPTGAILAAYLGQFGVRCIVLEKESEIVTDPRGIVLDEDGIRAAQACGIYDKLFTEIGTTMGHFCFINGEHTNLHKQPFAKITYDTTNGGTGHPGFMTHKQPILEKNLRLALQSHKCVSFKPSCTVENISEDKDFVYVTYRDNTTDSVSTIQAKYLASCDGKTGYTRKKYLEPKGIILENTTFKYQETWVAINMDITLPTPATHPDFPLWAKGYTPKQVYDLFFPEGFRFMCNPSRPAVCGRFGMKTDKLWRFEYVIHPDEDETEMSTWEQMKKIVFPYLTQPGSRCGTKEDVQFPEDCMEVLRCRPFKFAARSCNKWALGRTIILGDAAHVFPPFGGQGIASGFRDAVSLAWRLSVAVRPGFVHNDDFFTAWYRERKQQLVKSLNATVQNGKYVTEANKYVAFAREWGFWLANMIPPVARWVEQSQRHLDLVKYQYEDGLHFTPLNQSGSVFPQVYCVCLANNSGKVMFTDDAIFASSKSNLFQLVVLVDSLSDVSDDFTEIERLSANELSVNEVTYIVHNSNIGPSPVRPNVYRVATGEEFAGTSLCTGRPIPKYYDEFRMRKEMGDSKYIILRPDKVVYAACKTMEELSESAKSLAKLLGH